MRLFYSERALEDIEGLLEYISRDNPSAAITFVEGIIETCQTLARFTGLGQTRDDLSLGLRLFSYRRYGIYYRIRESDGRVKIVRVLHPSLDVRQQSFE